jgi:predicted molibdopterin-dependent oxidoreductase YjgC
VIFLPAQGNLAGSLLMGAYPELIPGGYPTTSSEQKDKIGNCWGICMPDDLSQPDTHEAPDGRTRQVLFLIGEPAPAADTTHDIVIYQNIYPPSGDCRADLLLPAAAFTEMDGTFINYAGRVQEIRRAVPPPGEALPAWQVLSRIARTMGAKGFDYINVKDIQLEIADLVKGFRINSQVNRAPLSPVFSSEPVDQRFDREFAGHLGAQPQNPHPARTGEHSYMGFPLTTWVEGLKMLYPEEN